MSRGGPGGPRAVDPLRGTRRADVRQRAAPVGAAPPDTGDDRSGPWPELVRADQRRAPSRHPCGRRGGSRDAAVRQGAGRWATRGSRQRRRRDRPRDQPRDRTDPPSARPLGRGGRGFGFPSGHTTAATVAAGLIGWTVSRHLRSVRGRVVVWVAAAAWAGGVGWSRVWLGVHWPTDVLGV
ncbi:MAG: phosphatase PAP2 family protein [Cellulomonas sp.]|nr:phosphatase PAP2 family protein [Cellulomonas sp.]